MTTDLNQGVVRRFVEEVINRADTDAIDEVITPDYVDHAALPGAETGPERVRQMIAGLRRAFPDFRFEIFELLAIGDRVVLRGVGCGTHLGEFLGIPATGRPVSVTQLHIVRLADGRIVEHWAESDWLCAVHQIGRAPAFLQPAAAI